MILAGALDLFCHCYCHCCCHCHNCCLPLFFPHLGLHLHGGPVRLHETPAAGHVDRVPGVPPPVVHKLLGRLVLLRLGNGLTIHSKLLQTAGTVIRCKNLAESFDDDSVQAGVGAHSLVQQRFRLNSKLDAPAQISLEPLKKKECAVARDLRRSVGAPLVLPSSG